MEQPDIVEQLRAGLKLESLAVKISNPFLVEAAKEAADIIEALRQRLFDLGEEVETWKSRYGAEHEEHEATMRAWEEERSGM